MPSSQNRLAVSCLRVSADTNAYSERQRKLDRYGCKKIARAKPIRATHSASRLANARVASMQRLQKSVAAMSSVSNDTTSTFCISASVARNGESVSPGQRENRHRSLAGSRGCTCHNARGALHLSRDLHPEARRQFAFAFTGVALAALVRLQSASVFGVCRHFK